MRNNTLFDKFKIVDFNGIKTKDFFTGFDVVQLTNNSDYFMTYIIDQEANIDYISYSLYGDSSYYWTILLVNNIQDVFFDLPMTSKELELTVKNELKEEIEKITTNQTEIEKYISLNYYTKYKEIEDINNSKRAIKVVRPEFIRKFVALLESTV